MSDDKKLIIDEDWKSQVQAEKEAAAQRAHTDPPAEPAAASGKTATEQDVDDPPMPPASFEMLITMLATEALVALGQVPHPVTGEAQVHRNHAQYLIDTLDLLRQKSQGNLTPAEQQLLESILHQLRIAFVQTAANAK